MKKVKIANRRRLILIVSVVVLSTLLSLVLYKTITKVRAWDRTWTQTDWRGGIFSEIITENTETFLEKEGIDSTQENVITLEYKDDWNGDYMDWLYRKKITFDNTLTNIGVEPENLVNFPVLVKLEDGVNIDYSKTNNDGSDIRFVDTDGTELSYEIESWDETGDSYVWVKVPQIDSGDQDYIYIYYGNTSATDNQNAIDVWSNGYTVVFHLSEDSGTTVYDSTSNSNDGTLVGTTFTQDFLGGLRTFFGSGNYIVLQNDVEYID
jgi:hypothetical protein